MSRAVARQLPAVARACQSPPITPIRGHSGVIRRPLRGPCAAPVRRLTRRVRFGARAEARGARAYAVGPSREPELLARFRRELCLLMFGSTETTMWRNAERFGCDQCMPSARYLFSFSP
eukprot:Amastigsp_a677643_188.p3 type:complete len:119 gc:universal Amastigsp_a677643_188:673-317(-)